MAPAKTPAETPAETPPARTPPRPYHHGHLRDALLAAAEAELAAHGLERFSLRAVAKRAGVSHAAPAHHFGDIDGLLNALAADGFIRFLAAQRAHEAEAAPMQPDRVVAAGLGYIAFATAHPALFRLMFSSDRLDFENAPLLAPATEAFGHLLGNVAELRGIAEPLSDPAALMDATAIWAMVHGLAELMQTGRARFLLGLPQAQRQAATAAILRRSLTP